MTYQKLVEGESELQILERLKGPHIEPPSRILLHRSLSLFWRLKNLAIVTGILVLGCFLFLFFIPTTSQPTKKVLAADDHVRYALFCIGQARFDGPVMEFEEAFKMEPSYANRYRKQLASFFLKRGKANLPQKLEMAIKDSRKPGGSTREITRYIFSWDEHLRNVGNTTKP